MENDQKKIVKNLLDTIKKESFVKGYEATDEEAMGLLLSKYFEYAGVAILESAMHGLEDANFHKESEQVQNIIENTK